MNATAKILHPLSPLLREPVPSLAPNRYWDADWYARELREIWTRNWNYIGRAAGFAAGTMHRRDVAGVNVIIVRSKSGELTAFHNVCPHRGSELCLTDVQPLRGNRILCPYHAWSFKANGTLASTGAASRAEGFDADAFGLRPVALREWNGMVFVCPSEKAPSFGADNFFQVHELSNWPMNDLVEAYRETNIVEANWKVIWENFNECLHCPGVHPSLCSLIPVHKKGHLAPHDAGDWDPETAQPEPTLRPGARSWTLTGEPIAPDFPGLSDAERDAGQTYAVVLPTLFVVAHVDFVSIVSIRPLGPERTEVSSEVLVAPETLANPDFDVNQIVLFNMQVQNEDAAACEMNQRGLRSSPFEHGILMPEEYQVREFHEWVQRQLIDGTAGGAPNNRESLVAV